MQKSNPECDILILIQTNQNLSENEEQLKWRHYNNMKIEGNQKELDAMVEFHKGNRVEGLQKQKMEVMNFR